VRFPVQDVYKVDDRRILAGRVERGRMRLGQELVFLPGGEKATVNAIEIFGQEPLNEAEAGRSIGVTLDDPLFVERGHVACDPSDIPGQTGTIRAKLFWMATDPLNANDRLTLRCATQQTDVTVEAIRHRVDTSALDETAAEADRLERYDVGEVILRTREPIVVEPHEAGTDLGRFVLSRGDDVLAGGIVLTQ
jgi:sulfate adenylyltransferase subunit 1 (EFTu-like GTPase family)